LVKKATKLKLRINIPQYYRLSTVFQFPQI
jgi:hypothetical protein